MRELPRHRGPLATWTAWVAPKTMKTVEAAKAVGMSEPELREVNRIPVRMLIKVGSTLVVPRAHGVAVDVPSHLADNATITLAPDAPPLRKLTLKAGRRDSVASIARRYRVSAAQVAHWNHTSAGARFRHGESIVVYVAQPAHKARRAASTRAHDAHGHQAPRAGAAFGPCGQPLGRRQARPGQQRLNRRRRRAGSAPVDEGVRDRPEVDVLELAADQARRAPAASPADRATAAPRRGHARSPRLRQ